MFGNIGRKSLGCLLGLMIVIGTASAVPFSGTVVDTGAASVLTVKPDDGTVFGEEMRVEVSAGDAKIGYLNEWVRGNLLEGNNGWYLDSIWPGYGKNEAQAEVLNRKLCAAAAHKNLGMPIKEGEIIPDFALFNQKGEVVFAKDLRGKTVVMTFVFSRCATPTMCPSNLARMMRMHREVNTMGLKDVLLVLRSFDPDYDIPGVLNAYAKSHRIDNDDFMLLTGDRPVIDALMKEFGVFVVPAEGTISHTSVAVIVNKQGALAHRKAGFRWNVRDFVDRVKLIN